MASEQHCCTKGSQPACLGSATSIGLCYALCTPRSACPQCLLHSVTCLGDSLHGYHAVPTHALLKLIFRALSWDRCFSAYAIQWQEIWTFAAASGHRAEVSCSHQQLL